NAAPVVNAGSTQTVTLPAVANMSATASDDGLPSGTLQTTWSAIGGPGAVSFSNPNSLTTTATFSTAGRYSLRLTASDGTLSSNSDLAIVVNAATTTATNTAPVVNAGSGQTITLPGGANLTGTASDDGLPNGTL